MSEILNQRLKHYKVRAEFPIEGNAEYGYGLATKLILAENQDHAKQRAKYDYDARKVGEIIEIGNSNETKSM